MKRQGKMLEAVADPDNLRMAFINARRGKAFSSQVLKYTASLDQNLFELRSQILNNLVCVGNYKYFKVFDPKERQICAAAFHEQVLHHALMQVCHARFEKAQIDQSFASRKYKGVYAALDCAKKHSRQYSWFLKLDVKKFFESIHHKILINQLSRQFKDSNILHILEKIIDSYEVQPDRGVPIGNLTSQYFANNYLSPLDHLIKEVLKCKAYIRYMDDMVIWHHDKSFLKEIKDEICTYVEINLKCAMKPPLLNTSERGLPFLGYLVYPNYLHLTQRSKRRFAEKIKNLITELDAGEINDACFQRKALPLIAFTRHADSLQFRKNVLSNLYAS